jgi:site-specific DNA recombinase
VAIRAPGGIGSTTTLPRSIAVRWRRCKPGEQGEAVELIGSLVDEIVLVPQGEGLGIRIQGALAGILELCGHGKTPGRGRASAEPIKVVAGAGFEPATFRL